LVEQVLTTIAAQLEDGPCCSFLGSGGAGHFVKMVHNGIEYGIIQIIAEAYDIMSTGLGLTTDEIQRVFWEWNQGELSSYLIEITADVLAKEDADTGRSLIQVILDSAEQKGTGRWTSQTAMELGVPTPTIDAAVVARNLSAQRKLREKASAALGTPTAKLEGQSEETLEALRDAVNCSIIASYAQGLAMFSAAREAYGYDIDAEEVARIWRDGCIIRAELLRDIREAYRRDPGLEHLLVNKVLAERLRAKQRDWRRIVTNSKSSGIPTPAMSASLDLFDSYRKEKLPANLIQGLRDHFGAHGFRRVDKDGRFSTH
jgi:6-phosphogluconate dehydrogenase